MTYEDKAPVRPADRRIHRLRDIDMQKRMMVRDDGRYLIYYNFERSDRQLERESDGEEGR